MEGSRARRRSAVRPVEVTAFGGTTFEKIRWWVLIAFLVLCLLGGGSNRPDAASLLYLRPAAVIATAAFLLIPGQLDFRSLRIPLVLLGAYAAAVLVQLVPLPPAIWLSLPGRDLFAEAAEAGGFAQPWRPISLTPGATWNSLVALLVPLAVLAGMAGLRRDQQQALLPLLIAFAILSAVFGILQLADGMNGPTYLYQYTHEGMAVGFFANRNHQATLLAMTFPMLRVWALMPAPSGYSRVRALIAIALAIFLVPMILVTGSRAGVVLALVGLVAAYLIAPVREMLPRAGKWVNHALSAAILAVPLVLALLVAVLGRDIAFQRMFAQDYESELRLRNTPAMLDMLQAHFPVGTGYGSFDAAFKAFEPDGVLGPRYFNRAHNDFLEVAITGGLPGLLLLGALLLWVGWAGVSAFRAKPVTVGTLLARVAAAMGLILAAASVIDYPLRAPLMTAVATIGCGWLALRWLDARQGQGSSVATPLSSR